MFSWETPAGIPGRPPFLEDSVPGCLKRALREEKKLDS